MDKRDLSTVFRDRLKLLLTRSDLNQSAFAAAVGIDRSALSQLISGASTRLPRAETLLNIAAEFKVSLDWLLGLSHDVVDGSGELAAKIVERYPQAVFFMGQLVFPEETLFSRLLHNNTVFAVQRRLYHQGIPFIILPIRINLRKT